MLRGHGIGHDTFYRSKKKYGGLGVSDARRMKQPENENKRLKGIVADQVVNIQAQKDTRGNKRTSAASGRRQAAGREGEVGAPSGPLDGLPPLHRSVTRASDRPRKSFESRSINWPRSDSGGALVRFAFGCLGGDRTQAGRLNQVRPHGSLGGRTPEEFASDTLESGEDSALVHTHGVRE